MRLIKVLVECLWYLDGCYHIFEKQGYVIPKIFTNFSGYNVPEASKHHKRALDNMAVSVLCDYSTSLLSCLQAAYWKESIFLCFKKELEQLTESLVGYQNYLESQIKMKLAHDSDVPIHKISDCLSIEFMKKNPARLPCFTDLSQTLSSVDSYQHLFVTDF